MVIGTGGKVVKEIKEKTSASIDIEDDGTVYLTGLGDSCEQARKMIEQITWEAKVGDKFRGEVVKITEFGAFVRVNGGAEGLLHISEICPQRIKSVDEKLKVGDIVPVVVKEVDDRGRLKFSVKDIAPDWFEKVK
jgi:polyribonucleotide nucleotidyltransferase